MIKKPFLYREKLTRIISVFIYVIILSKSNLLQANPLSGQIIEQEPLRFNFSVTSSELSYLSKFLNINAENYMISKTEIRDIILYRINDPQFCKEKQCLSLVSKMGIIVNYFYSDPYISHYTLDGIYHFLIENKCATIDRKFNEIASEEKTKQLMCGDLK